MQATLNTKAVNYYRNYKLEINMPSLLKLNQTVIHIIGFLPNHRSMNTSEIATFAQ